MKRGFGKGGQGATEFAIIFGFVLFFFVVFFAAIQENQNRKNIEKDRIYLQNVAINVQKEISIASGSSDGYIREFTIPQTILGSDYFINNSQGYLQVELNNYWLVYDVQEVNGSVKKGTNIIKKENGTVFIN